MLYQGKQLASFKEYLHLYFLSMQLSDIFSKCWSAEQRRALWELLAWVILKLKNNRTGFQKDTYCKLPCILLLCVSSLSGYLNLTGRSGNSWYNPLGFSNALVNTWHVSEVDCLVISYHYPLPMKSNSNFKQISSLRAACDPTLLYPGIGSDYQLNIVKIIKCY